MCVEFIEVGKTYLKGCRNRIRLVDMWLYPYLLIYLYLQDNFIISWTEKGSEVDSVTLLFKGEK